MPVAISSSERFPCFCFLKCDFSLQSWQVSEKLKLCLSKVFLHAINKNHLISVESNERYVYKNVTVDTRKKCGYKCGKQLFKRDDPSEHWLHLNVVMLDVQVLFSIQIYVSRPWTRNLFVCFFLPEVFKSILYFQDFLVAYLDWWVYTFMMENSCQKMDFFKDIINLLG